MDAIIPLPDSKSQKLLIGKVGGDSEDMISKLPDNLLLHILSFLPIKDVLRTSALSTRWKHLWTCVSDIDFDEYLYRSTPWNQLWQMRSSFLDSVERVLLHDSSCIQKLRLHLYGDVSASRVNSWVSSAVNRKVVALNLRLDAETPFVLPDSLFISTSLKSLELNLPFEVPSLPLIHFSNLKILSLIFVVFPSGQVAEQLFYGCPVLEELFLHYCQWKNNEKITITISIPTLRKFSICCIDNECDCVIKIYAENLLSLECIDCLAVELLPLNLCSLVTAYFAERDKYAWEIEEYAEHAVHLFRAIHNVKSLTLSGTTLELFSAVVDLRAFLPMYHSLTHFKVECGCDDPNKEGLMCFLQKSPNLESLEIDQLFFEIDDWLSDILPRFDVVPQCFTSSLKTVAISIHEEDNDMLFLKYLLENAITLERIKIFCVDSDAIDFVKQEINPLLKANRMGSTSCLIEFSEIDYW